VKPAGEPPGRYAVNLRTSRESQIRDFYRELFRLWGRQHWWPAQSRFEVIVGAYLTQNTAWTNVERALANLRRVRLLHLNGIRGVPLAELEQLIRPAGYFRQKAARLKTFINFLDTRYAGSLDRMFARSTAELRTELLALNGVGPETADSILLYAGGHPVFVVDAYTRRLLERHRILPRDARYEEIRRLFEQALSAEEWPVPGGDRLVGARQAAQGASHSPSRMSTARRSELVQVFNEMHGLIVGVAKNYCLASKALCEQCPLGKFPHKRVRAGTCRARFTGGRET
jgi:endonuclease III related protein